MKKFIIFALICLVNNFLFAQGSTMEKQQELQINKDYIGYYSGDLIIDDNNKLPLIVEIKDNLVLFSSPAQNANNIELSYNIENNNIKIESNQFKFSIEGIITKDSIIGQFKQSGMDFDIQLDKKDANEINSINRPQTPKTFNYKTKEITIINKSNNRKYYGSITTPMENIKNTVILFITGSGIQDRDEELFNHKPFLVISDYLTNNGYYTLRCDDYGFHGEDITNQTTYDIINDISSQIDYIKTELPNLKIVLLGHSEGAIVAQALANKVDAIILESGPAISGEETYKFQVLHALEVNNANQNTLDLFSGKIDEVTSALMNDDLSIKQKKAVVVPYIKMLGNNNNESIEASFNTLSSKWYTTFLKINPRDYIKKINVPTLVLQGTNDTQVDADLNIPIYKELLKSDKKIIVYKDYNHLLQKSTTGEVSEYNQIQTTIEPNVLVDILNFLNSLN